MSDRHDWNSWQDYLAVHESRMRDFEYFVVADELTATPTEHQIYWDGVIYCQDGIEIHVTKLQEVSHHARPMVRTVRYSYHIQQKVGSSVTRIFRYDNVGDHGGDDRHHCHRFAPDGTESVEHVRVDDWPTLGDVIEFAAKWWEEWSERRPNPPTRS